MKILICTGIFPPEAGGPATYSKSLAEKLIKRGHEVVVITYVTRISSPLTGEDKGEGDFSIVRITRSWFKPWHYYKYFKSVKKHGKDADVLYAQDPVSAGYPALLASKVLKKPFLVKITGDYSWERAMGRKFTGKLIDEFQKLPSYPKPIRKMRNIQIHVAKSADGVIAPSEYLKRLIVGWGVKEKRVRVIYNSIEPIPEIPKDEARRDLGIADNEFLILSVGRNVPWKGFEVLKEVANKLVIPAQAGIQFNIKLVILNNTNRETTNKYFRAADLFVLNTGYEGFSHTILEAMSAGLPVITTNIGGNPEVIQNGVNGILVEYNNKEQIKEAILKLFNDSELRKQVARNAKQILNKYSLDRMISQTEEALARAWPA